MTKVISSLNNYEKTKSFDKENLFVVRTDLGRESFSKDHFQISKRIEQKISIGLHYVKLLSRQLKFILSLSIGNIFKKWPIDCFEMFASA